MTGPHLVYFADPMCSWCWGFAPVVDAISEIWGESLPIRLILGGLRPGNTTPMTDEARAQLRGHWVHVTEASSQGFGAGALATPGFIYDTDPAARAVVLMCEGAPGREIACLRDLQKAFYQDGLDITDLEVLAGFAPRYGLEAAPFLAALRDPEVKQRTWRDYAVAQNAGVTGFPTLILGPMADGTYAPITRGFQPAGAVIPMIARLTGGVEAPETAD
jgi:putative protein-disulfide isomerase